MNTPVKWVNTEPDAGAPHALLLRLAERVPPTSIDEIWIFPTRRIAIGESTVFVVAARTDDPERNRVITARYAVNRNNRGIATVQEKIDEHGTAPASAVPRIVQGVLRRMGEEGEQPPRAERVEGEAGRWWALVVELGGRDDSGTDESGTDDARTDDVGTDDVGADDIGTDDRGRDDIGTDDRGRDDIGTADHDTDDARPDELGAGEAEAVERRGAEAADPDRPSDNRR